MIQAGWRRVDPRLATVDGALALIAVVVIVQMWLLTATLESWLAGHHGVALPAALASGGLCAVAVALLLVVNRADRRAREERDLGRDGA